METKVTMTFKKEGELMKSLAFQWHRGLALGAAVL